MSSLEPRNSTIAGPKYFNIVETQEKINIKRAFMNVMEVLKEEMNKYLK